MNNAGLMACPLTYLPAPNDTIESQFGVNHLGPFLFTNLLLSSKTPTTPKMRIVTLSSIGHTFQPDGHKGINFAHPGFLLHPPDGGETYERWDAYAQAKTAAILFAGALMRRGYEAVSVNPGGIATGLQRHLSKEDQIAAGQSCDPIHVERSRDIAGGLTWYVCSDRLHRRDGREGG